jgi:hypothetical protein
MTVSFGMNDAASDLSRFLTGLQGIADQARTNVQVQNPLMQSRRATFRASARRQILG